MIKRVTSMILAMGSSHSRLILFYQAFLVLSFYTPTVALDVILSSLFQKVM